MYHGSRAGSWVNITNLWAPDRLIQPATFDRNMGTQVTHPSRETLI